MASQEWYKDEFLVSTSQQLLQPEAINAAFGSDLMYWCSEMSKEDMKKMLQNSLCFGLYALPTSSAELAGQKTPPQIGFARVITDQVTFAYLTDVYVLAEYQGKGLGKWLIDCVSETTERFPVLRATLLISSDGPGINFYRERMGMEPFELPSLKVLWKKGSGSALKN